MMLAKAMESDLAEMDDEEIEDAWCTLRAQADTLLDDIGGIERSLAHARDRTREDWERPDPEWLRATEGLLARKQRAIRVVNRRVNLVEYTRSRRAAERSRDDERMRTRAREGQFIEAARLVLDKQTYLSIWDLVDRDHPAGGTHGRIG